MSALLRVTDFVARHWILLLVVLANLAIAGPVQARFDDDVCEDPETGEFYHCCEWCMIFCSCDAPE